MGGCLEGCEKPEETEPLREVTVTEVSRAYSLKRLSNTWLFVQLQLHAWELGNGIRQTILLILWNPW